jgi:hypothetical protein
MDSILNEYKKSEIIILPSFIYSGLIRNNLTLDDFLDLDKVSKNFSLEDLSFVLLLNEQNNKIFNCLIDNSLFSKWCTNIDIFEQINKIKSLQEGVLDTRLAQPSLQKNNQKCFEIKDNHHDVIFVIVYPDMFSSEETKNSASKEIIYTLLKLLYGYNDYDIVARHPLFEKYLSVL